MEVNSLHKKIEYYLMENEEKNFPFPLIANEVICYANIKNTLEINIEKLDLLGADKFYFYMIEIKTNELTMTHIMKYEKAHSNFYYFYRSIKIIFVASSISKKAREYIENSDRYEIIYITISELDKISNYTINNKMKNKHSCFALDEYRISFLIKTFFNEFDLYISDFKFDNEIDKSYGEIFSTITYKFDNNYDVILYIGKDNNCLIDTIFDNGIDRRMYTRKWVGQSNNEILQIIYIQKLMLEIKKMPNKKIKHDEFSDMSYVAVNNTFNTLQGYNKKKYKKLYNAITQTFTKHYKYDLKKRQQDYH